MQKSPTKTINHHWEEPEKNFERIHIDYAGPMNGRKFFLVLVDAKSKWPEIRVINQAPTSESTIKLLENIFSFHGLPRVMVSDNASIFKSEIFMEYCSANSIIQKFIAPGHPSTNGLAERHVQILKTKLLSMNSTQLPIASKVQEIVYRYRATPQHNNKTPSEMYLGRNIRTRLDSLLPYKPKHPTPQQLLLQGISAWENVYKQDSTPIIKTPGSLARSL